MLMKDMDTEQPDSQAGDEQTVDGVRLNLRDIVARNNTGYSYEELKQAIKDGEDLLEDDELESVDRTVNLLGHFIRAYAERLATERAIEELVELNTHIINDQIHGFINNRIATLSATLMPPKGGLDPSSETAPDRGSQVVNPVEEQP